MRQMKLNYKRSGLANLLKIATLATLLLACFRVIQRVKKKVRKHFRRRKKRAKLL